MIVSANRILRHRSREGFTLLEVLVVVAIIVILAGVAGVSMFRYIEIAKIDTAKAQMATFESACKHYMTRSDGNPPDTLQELVAPSDGSKPLVDGGLGALNSPFTGVQYGYDKTHVDNFGSPDPIVSLTLPDGQVIYSTRRK